MNSDRPPHRCPHCGGRFRVEPDPPVTAPTTSVDQIRADCLVAGMTVIPGDRVREDGAAMILDRAPGTLRNWRSAGCGPPFKTVRGRAVYEIADLIAFIDG